MGGGTILAARVGSATEEQGSGDDGADHGQLRRGERRRGGGRPRAKSADIAEQHARDKHEEERGGGRVDGRAGALVELAAAPRLNGEEEELEAVEAWEGQRVEDGKVDLQGHFLFPVTPRDGEGGLQGGSEVPRRAEIETQSRAQSRGI